MQMIQKPNEIKNKYKRIVVNAFIHHGGRCVIYEELVDIFSCVSKRLLGIRIYLPVLYVMQKVMKGW